MKVDGAKNTKIIVLYSGDPATTSTHPPLLASQSRQLGILGSK